MYEDSICKADSRRSIDWRDSGIVLDDFFNPLDEGNDDQKFNQLAKPSLDIQDKDGSLFHIPNYERRDSDGDTILHIAIVSFSEEEVEDLLDKCDINALNKMMQTPLHIAVMANRREMVELLIKSNKCKINCQDCRGNTPLHIACSKGYQDVARIILASVDAHNQRDQLDMTNFDGCTCLHLAASNGHHQVIELLVKDFGANINCHDSKSGATIMHTSIMNCDVDSINFILNLDSHCNEPDFYGRRPLKTIKILISSTRDPKKTDQLREVRDTIRKRIKLCIEKSGCCNEEQYEDEGDEIIDSSSSSSSSSDVDSDA